MYRRCLLDFVYERNVILLRDRLGAHTDQTTAYRFFNAQTGAGFSKLGQNQSTAESPKTGLPAINRQHLAM